MAINLSHCLTSNLKQRMFNLQLHSGLNHGEEYLLLYYLDTTQKQIEIAVPMLVIYLIS